MRQRTPASRGLASGFTRVVLLLSAASQLVGCDSADRRSRADGGHAGDSAVGEGDAGPAGRDPALLARAAVVLGSCFPDDGINRNLAHLWAEGPRLWHRFEYAAECLAARGGGCRALETCVGWSIEPSSDRQCRSCSGSVAERCGDGARIRIDCAKLGLQCDEQALCSDAPAVACDGDSFAARCTSDGRPEFCDDGVVFKGLRCAELGLTCIDGDCSGTGAACTDRSSGSFDGTLAWDGVSCAGSTLLACVQGRMAELDCAEAGPGFGCASFEGSQFCGLGSECLPGELPGAEQRGTPVRCEGTTVAFCNAGRIERIDCRSLGFAACDARSGLCTGASAPD